MFDARIITGCWEDGIIELSGMPEDFILSNRTVVVAEKKEITKLQAKVTRLEEERADWIRRHNDKAVKLQTAQAEVNRLEEGLKRISKYKGLSL